MNAGHIFIRGAPTADGVDGSRSRHLSAKLVEVVEATPTRLYCIYRFAEHSQLVEAVFRAARQAIAELRFVMV